MDETAPGRAICGLVLAAGSSRRMGELKQTIVYRGQSLIGRAVEMVADVTGRSVTVVTGAGADRVADALSRFDVRIVRNDAWPRGIGYSLAVGVDALRATADAILVLGCDQQEIVATDLRRLVAAWRTGPDRPAAARYAGVLGVPVIFPRSWFEQLGLLDGDQGARELLRRAPEDVTAVDMPNAARDLDERRDLEAWRRHHALTDR